MRNDGGGAFAGAWDYIIVDQTGNNPAQKIEARTKGMSLRDYFAIHGDQPGQLEISSAAGVELRDYSPLPFNSEERKKLPTWHEWFDSLDQTTRLALYAKVRYQIADAMLAERDKP